MYNYKAKIDLSFMLEEQESGDDAWMEKFSQLEEDSKFHKTMKNSVKWDLDTTIISNVKIISKTAEFSDTPGMIDVLAEITFVLRDKYEDLDEEKRDDVLWEIKNGITFQYLEGDEEYDFLSALDDTQVKINSI